MGFEQFGGIWLESRILGGAGKTGLQLLASKYTMHGYAGEQDFLGYAMLPPPACRGTSLCPGDAAGASDQGTSHRTGTGRAEPCADAPRHTLPQSVWSLVGCCAKKKKKTSNQHLVFFCLIFNRHSLMVLQEGWEWGIQRTISLGNVGRTAGQAGG